MRKIQVILILLLFTGCGLLPRKVEYFQKEVKEMPHPDTSHKEKQKQAADFISRRTADAFTQAIIDNSSTNVLIPIRDTEIVANSLSGSLGKPLDRWTQSGKNLAYKLDREDALLDKSIENFRERNDSLAGKNIEGTGLIQVGYLTNLLFFAILGIGAYIIIKVLGVLNPNVAIGTKIIGGGVRGVSNLISKGFSEVVAGGEEFKKKLDAEIQDQATKEKIKALFRQAQMEKQSPEVQDTIKSVTL